MNFITLCDGYKLDHRRQYPKGTEYIYSNLTARGSRVPGVDKVVFFGLQYFLQRYLQEEAADSFFDVPRGIVLRDYERLLRGYLGPVAASAVGVHHVAELHDYGKIPLRFRALPEGTRAPLRLPMMTWENTRPEFYWVTNYIETLLSNSMWLPCTSATTAHRYRQLLDSHARETGDPAFVDWQAHDFSFRGLAFPEAAAMSALGHLLSFRGTDTVPALELAQGYYDTDDWVGGSVAATEHAVMCAGEKGCEEETFRRLLDLYPSGTVSVVSDTWDLWNVHTEILPKLKERIMGREGKLVIRPDSGDPVQILCGDKPGMIRDASMPSAKESARRRGVIETLWHYFGGTTNAKGYKVLDPHVGAIYGDSITVERAQEICERLEAKGFASTNVVLGVGSYTYQYVTRDTYGFAVKATWARVNGQERLLFKDPVTDSGLKKSARGRVVVVQWSGQLEMIDSLTRERALEYRGDLLEPVWEEGRFLRRQTFEHVREVLRASV